MLQQLLVGFQERRAKVTDEERRAFMSVRPMEDLFGGLSLKDEATENGPARKAKPSSKA